MASSGTTRQTKSRRWCRARNVSRVGLYLSVGLRDGGMFFACQRLLVGVNVLIA